MRMLILAGVCIALAGCGVQVRKADRHTADAAVADLTYAQDPNTHLCYSVISTAHVGSLNDTSASITWVPCTTEVLARVHN